ncbi:MAG: T9SS type A sorting domain-containing protein [Bacteroidales bacterium]|nr:T9SS type A sorting domain-containing protein [Bacteroidales bacterium]MCF8389570.1 T9SS type A sorting domain-containing protein [Bacteroidales bacterium]
MLRKLFSIIFYSVIMQTLFSQADIYPVMQGVDLSPDFTVRIDDGSGFKAVPVQDIVDVCFVNFAMTGSVQIEITVNQSIESWRIGPEKFGIIPEINDQTMSFALDNPAKLIVLINEGAGNHTLGLDGLCILADNPETDPPQLSDPDVVNIMDYEVDPLGNVLATSLIQQAFNDHNGQGKIIYFPAGIYKSGMLHMRSNQSLYLAPGAVLMGSSDFNDYQQIAGEGSASEKYLIGSWKSNNIKIFGRGIINGNGTALRLQDPEGADFKTHNIQFQGSNNVTIEGIISLDAGSWSIEPIYCDSILIRNVKVMSDLRYYESKLNTDGIDLNKCRHLLIEDCLIWSGDDAITPKQDNTYNSEFPFRNINDHVYRNMTIFTRKAAIKIGSETYGPGKEFYDMLFQDFNIVYADRAMNIWSEFGAIINYITFKDFNIEKISTEYKQSHIHCWINNEGNSIKNIKFINIQAKEPAPLGSSFIGDNLNKTINGKLVQYYNIHFSNYTIAGEPVLSLEDSNAKFNLHDDSQSADPSAFSFESGTVSTDENRIFPSGSLSVYPNPFDKSCNISFEIERKDHVQIVVKNLEGQILDEIIDTELCEGTYNVEWICGAGFSGIYLVYLFVGGARQIHKIVKF